ncbi:hypothetical protein PF005_g28764 [Phytophthora fragariae]|uniref:Uncharacterized protein n=1 Tax=Phytophthora fragariae TaxID=53985 RepID=A0A6A3QAT9_9STRA|nr:hypothetical protein PF003_g25637 [Phytophthora fragariae]KAE8922940.1 hypothetical protein PF009_g26801 [Phytophthora fragariae]KAE8973692.1 hypothetical protein PF011_g25149 [Phytophthora fragariae]KAE9064554.1 hypothetical protein PF010_g28563 [Phytophthora fragariae]KAE9072227.1 hypothetical protein PF007_g26254 [Phytophthora fragariae]
MLATGISCACFAAAASGNAPNTVSESVIICGWVSGQFVEVHRCCTVRRAVRTVGAVHVEPPQDWLINFGGCRPTGTSRRDLKDRVKRSNLLTSAFAFNYKPTG